MLKFQSLKHLTTHAFGQFAQNKACIDTELSWTYSQLRQRTEDIQQELAQHDIKPGDRICLCAPKSAISHAALLALIQSDCPYVPIDHSQPAYRVKQIIDDARVTGLIGSETIVQELSASYKSKGYAPLGNTGLYYISLSSVSREAADPDLAYVLYTSGSTGKPKGVMVTHQNALSFIQWAASTFDFSENDIFSSVAPFHFDLSVFDLFVSMWHGGSVVLFNDQQIRNPHLLSSIIQQERISVWYSTPTILVLMDLYGKMHKYDHNSLRKVFYAGEVFPIKHLRSVKSRWEHIDFFNLYGPTETNVCAWTKVPTHVDEDYDNSIIGKPCDHAECSVLADGQIKVPEKGIQGELVVNGKPVSPGYLNRQSDSHFHDEEMRLWYKTGDWVFVNEDLNFVFMGRKDRLIKRRGYRIELDEIQRAIEKHPLIVRASVFCTLQNDKGLIVACFEQGTSTLTAEDIRPFIKTLIPEYMVPDIWKAIDQIPLTSTHKTDYQKLAELY